MMGTLRCDHPDIEFILQSLVDMGAMFDLLEQPAAYDFYQAVRLVEVCSGDASPCDSLTTTRDCSDQQGCDW